LAGRTFAIGDVHGDAQALFTLLSRLPALDSDDTIVFLGDYVDRGPESARVVAFVRTLSRRLDAKVVTLRGNHEDAWLRVVAEGWPGFVIPAPNGCFAAYRSFVGGRPPAEDEAPTPDEMRAIFDGSFFPPDVVAWMRELPVHYEDEHAIYVHAGLPKRDGRWLHPNEVEPKAALFWARDLDFFQNYRGKRVVVGHTVTALLPPELSSYTPEDPTDLWAGVDVFAIDTGCGKGGFLTALELPSCTVYESR
jgi:serine/threonine protein phosphatase 1